MLLSEAGRAQRPGLRFIGEKINNDCSFPNYSTVSNGAVRGTWQRGHCVGRGVGSSSTMSLSPWWHPGPLIPLQLQGGEDACLKFEFAPFVMSGAACSQTNCI